ncbi:NfeD family protein [Flexithrix dorotheae]|uniref:NfeD family protein n=1 Tax=Flexithrix dorotheae TaxID=70993 RepID=UPI0003610F84|nr:NfeD family protein [Flexithrix dorotheae]
MNKFKLILLLFSLIQIPINLLGQNTPKVLVFEIRAEIDPRMNRHVQLALEEADNQNVDYIIIDMDTYGGAVNDADDIRSMILEYEKPVYVFINKNAASAGALISIACDSIYMEKGANIGAATVVNGVDGAKAPDKYQSYFRSIMRSTAEANGRNPKIAEAMVDENLEVEGVSEAGQVITFTASEAIKNGFCEGMAESVEDVLEINNIENAEIIKYKPSGTEEIIAFFLNPAISSLLILIIIGGLYFELQTPGVGFPIIASIMAAVLYFTPYYLNGLAANWEIIAFGVGVLLIAAEIFVIPGFGVAGISGIILTVGSLALVMVDNDWFDFYYVPTGDLKSALLATFGGTVGAIVLMFVGASQIKSSPFLKHIALNETLQKDEGYTSSFNSDQILVGLTGKAYTVLRPSGKIMIDGKIYDASTRGDYIEKGEEVIVISDEGTSLKVKKHEADKLVE